MMHDGVKRYAQDAAECARMKQYLRATKAGLTGFIGAYGYGAANGEFHDCRSYGCGGALGEGDDDGIGDGGG